MSWMDMIPSGLAEKYELYNINHAIEVLATAYPEHWHQITSALEQFSIPEEHILAGGGNESPIPKALNAILRPAGWEEARISGDLLVKLHRRRSPELTEISEHAIKNFIDSHNIDYVKGKVAVDMEWNSKDQTFDRDLLAMRTYYDCDIISAGIIITRAEDLNDVFRTVYDYDSRSGAYRPILRKYGASTTWMGKLIPRLESRRNGGCPILAIGMKKKCVVDWDEEYIDENSTANE